MKKRVIEFILLTVFALGTVTTGVFTIRSVQEQDHLKIIRL